MLGWTGSVDSVALLITMRKARRTQKAEDENVDPQSEQSGGDVRVQAANEEEEAQQAGQRDVEPRLRLGQRVTHRGCDLTGVVVGWDRACCEKPPWREANNTAQLSQVRSCKPVAATGIYLYCADMQARGSWPSVARVQLAAPAFAAAAATCAVLWF